MKLHFLCLAVFGLVGCHKSQEDGDSASDADAGNMDGVEEPSTDADGGVDTSSETGNPTDTSVPSDTASGDTATADTAVGDTATVDTGAGDTGAVEADRDGDGFTVMTGDCDDSDAGVHPYAAEMCDSIDNDCDGEIDESEAVDAGTWFADGDADGFGDAASLIEACTMPIGHVENGDDCDDDDNDIHPGAVEICDEEDNDCDLVVDEDDAVGAPVWHTDSDGDGYGDALSTTVACVAPVGTVADDTDCSDTDAAVHPAGEEACDTIDNDCDGEIDEGEAIGAVLWYSDYDADGFGSPLVSVLACAAPALFTSDATDCDDADNDIHPDAAERCDGEDNNCDGLTDDISAVDVETWFMDADEDGFGDALSPVSGCSAPTGAVTNSDDCDDAQAAVNPAADERCNGDDDDCDGAVDESDSVDAGVWFADDDGDGFGDPTTVTSSCSDPDGYVDDATDCDDTEESTYPGADEYCDGVDNNCDLIVDEDEAIDALTFFADADGDSFGDPGVTTAACVVPSAYVSDSSDCDDGNPIVHPGATEFCDLLDNDCDDVIDPDDSADALVWYFDVDADGYGDAATELMACTAPVDAIDDGTDCDDGDPAVNPEGVETCNDVDDDCDGTVDEGTDGECEYGACIEGRCATDCEPGKQDLYFGDAGFVIHDLGDVDEFRDMVTDASGRIVLTGGARSSNFETLRFTPTGELDTSFGDEGRVSTSFPVHSDGNAVDIDSEGRIVVAGSTRISCSMTWNRYALARYLEDGSLDPSFGDGGTQTTNWGSVGTRLSDIEFQTDGKIVLSGTRYAGACSPGITNSTVTRYTVDGHLDTSFGSGGEMRRDIPHGPHHDDNNALALGPDDSLWATGADAYWSWAGLQRYTSSGSFISEDVISTGYATAAGIEFNGVDRMIVATTDEVVQYGLDGLKIGWSGTTPASYSVDTSPAPFESTASSLQLDAEGRILILSKSSTSFRVVRYLPDGTLDASFGDGGIVEITPGYEYFRAGAIKLQPDGYIVVGGTAGSSSEDRDFALVRLCP